MPERSYLGRKGGVGSGQGVRHIKMNCIANPIAQQVLHRMSVASENICLQGCHA